MYNWAFRFKSTDADMFNCADDIRLKINNLNIPVIITILVIKIQIFKDTLFLRKHGIVFSFVNFLM